MYGTNSGESKGVVWKNLPSVGPEGIRLSPGAQPRGKVWLPQGQPVGKFSRQSLRTFQGLSYFWLQKPKKMWPRVAPWVCLEKQLVRTCSSLTVLNPDFGGWRTESVVTVFYSFLFKGFTIQIVHYRLCIKPFSVVSWTVQCTVQYIELYNAVWYTLQCNTVQCDVLSSAVL